MFAKITSLFFLAFIASALANPVPGGGHGQSVSGIVNSCNTGSIQCCQQLQDASSQNVSSLLGLLGIVLSGVTGQVGTSCTPITVIGLGQGASCHQAPVCCSDNHFDGLIAVGCTPINISL